MTQLEQRFWSHVDKSTDCWIWKASRSPRGYGKFWNNGDMRAHRQSWIFANGPIDPVTLLVCHKCDNPPCVNPNHLFLGTALMNEADKKRKGRQVRGERMSTSKLFPVDVFAIRANVDKLSIVGLARHFKVSTTMIKLIRSRRAWTHI